MMRKLLIISMAGLFISCSSSKYQPVLNEFAELYKLSLAGVEYYQSLNAELQELISKGGKVEGLDGFNNLMEEQASLRKKMEELSICSIKMQADLKDLTEKFKTMTEDLSDSEKEELLRATITELTAAFALSEASIQEYLDYCNNN